MKEEPFTVMSYEKGDTRDTTVGVNVCQIVTARTAMKRSMHVINTLGEQ